jgi:hypothetical protein
MSDKEAIQRLETLIEFFKNYDEMLSDIEKSIKMDQKIQLAA